MPNAERTEGPLGNAIYAVKGKSFVFFRNPRPDAVDEATGERLTDVVVFWVPSEVDKLELVDDPSTPFFTTKHFDGYNAVLLRSSRVGEITRDELASVVADAWACRATKKMIKEWQIAQATP